MRKEKKIIVVSAIFWCFNSFPVQRALRLCSMAKALFHYLSLAATNEKQIK